MNIQPDFEELLRLLEEQHVEYVIVGGYAVAFHGFPRFTKDIDVFYKRSESNVLKLRTALLKFGFTSEDIPGNLFLESGSIITFGVEPVRVDLINDISGVLFDGVWRNKVRGIYGKVEVCFIGKAELVKNKTSTGRAQDIADAENLG